MNPAIAKFVENVLAGAAWGIPARAQSWSVKFTVKPWAGGLSAPLTDRAVAFGRTGSATEKMKSDVSHGPQPIPEAGRPRSATASRTERMRLSPCILGTVCIPWRDDGEFAEATFRRATRCLIESGLNNLYIFGTAGEGHAVTTTLFRRIATAFHDEMRNGGVLCQLGVIAQSVPQVRERIDIGLDLGFRSFQISLPSWGELNDHELFGFFDDILGSYPGAQFLHYNTARALRRVTPAEYGRIATAHNNLVATKVPAQTLGDILALFRHAPQVCHFFTELEFACAGLFGACGFLISLASLNPLRAKEFYQAVVRRDLPEVAEFARELGLVREIVMGTFNSGQHMDAAYDKTFLRALVPDVPLRLLPPYQGTSDEEFEHFMELLARRVPAWRPQGDRESEKRT